MPTPVSVARQCLTDEAARVLDDAVSVARRRSHAQTTSLHIVSALLSLPSSALRDACTRARSSAYSSRLQFRALELCVGVSLDRVPSSKAVDDPPVSNSLMAAIKRSHANQRRHPDNFHLQQLHFTNNQTAPALKVELKHFILSILDDPTVSKVLGEAGFRSTDIKVAIIHPPLSQTAKWSTRTRCPPIFLCNFTDAAGFNFDENCRRISEVLVKKKNPLLVGVCAFDALKSFIECVNGDSGNKDAVLGGEISGLSVISIESEVSEFVIGGDKERIGVRFEEVGGELERCLGPGIVVNVGDLKVLVENNVSIDGVSFLVSKFTSLLQRFTEKMRIIAAAASYEIYMKFLGQFPSVEEAWDLHLLPITSSKSSVDSFGSKSSLMGSFVPLGGFFPMPADLKSPLNRTSRSMVTTIARCHLCTAKYEQELAAMLKTGSAVSVADQYAENLPSWLRMAEIEASKGMDAAKIKDDGIALNAKILGLEKKWNDICQRLHHAQPLSAFEFPLVAPTSQITIAEGSKQADRRESSSNSSSRDSSLNIGKHANPTLGIGMDSPKTLSEHTIPVLVTSRGDGANFQSKLLENVSRNQEKEKDIPWITHSLPSSSLPTDRTSSSSVTSVTTDLGLGTLYASSTWETNSRKLRDREELRLHYSGFSSTENDAGNEKTSRQVAQSSSCTGPFVGVQFDLQDYKLMRRALSEKVGWQDEAICTIVEAISRCRAGYGRNGGSNARRDIWLTFLGPDKVGKKSIASTLAETLFGSLESFVSVDFSSHGEFSSSNTIFGCQELNDYDVKFRGKTIVDYIATELRKKPHSLLFLENVDRADPQAQLSLSQAIRTGRFPDTYGREVSINNTIFVTTSTLSLQNKNPEPEKEANKFSEGRILGAKRLQMKIITELIAESAEKSNEMNAARFAEKTSAATAVNKRKLVEVSHSVEEDENTGAKKKLHKSSRTHLDLNLPVEETETDAGYCEGESDTISESSEAWLEEFFDQVDAKVEFKPFNFNILSENILKKIATEFLNIYGSEVPLEIEDEVIVQIIAASWLSDRREAMEEWVETILSRGFTESRQKYEPRSSSSQYVIKLISCKDLVAEEEAPGICLPARINL